MKNRCDNPNIRNFKNYGGRGIKVCPEWYDFNVFLDWAKASGYQDNLTIDRIDVHGNYHPDNCRWATKKQQARNTTKNRMITINGITKTMIEWSEESGLIPQTIEHRIKHGWPDEKLLIPTDQKFRNKKRSV